MAQADDAETLAADSHDDHAAVVQRLHLGDLGRAADGVGVRRQTPFGLALSDEDDAERPLLAQAVGHHLPVALLKDVQGQRHSRKKNDIQRKERQFIHG